jgi:VWFA-related protein
LIGLVVLAAWSMSGSAAFQDPNPTQKPAAGQEAPPVFRGGVEMVNLSVMVTDKNGRNVNGLKKEDFRVWEDKNQQEIVNFRTFKDPLAEPTGLGLVVDVSGSMSPDKLNTMRISVEELLRSGLKKEDELYYVEFAADTRLVVPWTKDRNSVMTAIRRIKTREQTAVYDAIMNALPVSAAGKHKKQVILVITDGEDTSSKTPREKVAAAARASDVIIYALVLDGEEALGQRANPRLRQAAGELSAVTDPTGGRTVYAQGYQQFEDAMAQLGKEFTQHYELGFVRGSADGQAHQLVVGVARENVTVRHRRVYVAD